MLAEWVQLTISQLGSADGLTAKWVQLKGFNREAPHFPLFVDLSHLILSCVTLGTSHAAFMSTSFSRLGDGRTLQDTDEVCVGSKDIVVNWMRWEMHGMEEFHEKLLDILPAGTQYFGGRRQHDDGSWSYHVVMSFSNEPYWPDARKRFSMGGPAGSVLIMRPWRGQLGEEFLQGAMAYCAEGEENFGRRWTGSGQAAWGVAGVC